MLLLMGRPAVSSSYRHCAYHTGCPVWYFENLNTWPEVSTGFVQFFCIYLIAWYVQRTTPHDCPFDHSCWYHTLHATQVPMTPTMSNDICKLFDAVLVDLSAYTRCKTRWSWEMLLINRDALCIYLLHILTSTDVMTGSRLEQWSAQ